MSLHTGHDSVCSASWVRSNRDQFGTDDPDARLVEVDMEPEAYDEWHIPGAVHVDWENDIVDGVGTKVVSAEQIEALLGDLGITPDTTVVLYGDRANWFAAHVYWVLNYYGHDDVQLLDGGRRYWSLEGHETTTKVPEYTTREYTVSGTDESIRAYKDGVKTAIIDETSLVDVRNPKEYRGGQTPAEIPETTDREGHIPTAENVPWGMAVNADGRFKSEPELRDIYSEHMDTDDDTITYCRIGERSSITWFVLSELLDASARNYDGSWTEWVDDEDTPVATGDRARTDGGSE